VKDKNVNALSELVRGLYDLQDLRMQTGNRIVSEFKARLGQSASVKEDDLDPEAQQILQDIRRAYKRLTDGVKTFPKMRSFKGDSIISDWTQLCLVATYVDLDAQEQKHFRRLKAIVERFPIYTKWLKSIKGIGPAIAAILITEIDIRKARYPSSLWAYAGLDVASDGTGRTNHKEHQVMRRYIDKQGNEQECRGITFNPFLKSKLLGVAAGSLLRCGNEHYATIYGDYKHRMESHIKWGSQNDGIKDADGRIVASKLRRHKQALRYMMKMFLLDLYLQWRPMAGLPVSDSYAVAKLGQRKHGT